MRRSVVGLCTPENGLLRPEDSCRLLNMVCGGMKMAHGDRKMACRTIEDVLLRLEDGLLHRLLKIVMWRTQHTDDCMRV